MVVPQRAAGGSEPGQPRKEGHLLDGNGKIYRCPICHKPPVEKVVTNCGHLFCLGCLTNVLQAGPWCPRCQTEVYRVQRVFT
ncbi:hypothetical protein M5D96_009189 [Drosophila gunungcola]|uniref:RING-type domain-containing protein n=1 Tax=Drosophila gunungcola TaxID=103775 RepID=A0A9P9YJL1_9MUSC|nr:hypothetical protein M5D96_009189 [Drosophila gunungcola]